MGGIRDRLTRFLMKGMNSFFTQSTIVGGKYVMMDDNPETYVKSGLLYNPDLASIINYIRKVAVGVPWVLKQGDTIVEKHPIIDVWANPNPMTTGKLLRGKWIEHFLVTGNAFLHGSGPLNGANAGKIVELYNLKYDLNIEKGTEQDPIKAYEDPNTHANYPIEDVLHWKTTDPDGPGFFGISPLKAGRLVLQQSNDSYLANSKSLQNMGAAGILTRKDLDVAGPEQAKKLKEKFRQEQQGAENFNKLTITQGEYEYIKFGLSPVDMALLESQVRSLQAMCNIYGFPSELLNDKAASTYNNMKEKRKILLTNIVMPLLNEQAEILDPWLVKPWGDNLTFEPDWDKVPELQDDIKELVEWLDKAWWIKGTEKQKISNVEEDKELDRYYIPMNLIPDEGSIDDETALKEYER